MPTLMRPRTTVDPEEFWVNKRVPRSYIKMFLFVQAYIDRHGCGPSWSLIATEMDWLGMERDAWRNRIRRGRRYGLKFRPGVPGSTHIVGRVIPHVREKADW